MPAVNSVFVSAHRTLATKIMCHPALQLSEVAISFSELYSRKRTSSQENTFDRIWEEKCTKNTRLHNKSKFRFSGSCKSDGKIVLMLGLTSYKELCVTNLSANFQTLMQEGLNDHDDKYSYLSQTLGVGILLLSSDRHLLLLRRSMWTGEAAGKWDRPGGHPEPSNIAELLQTQEIGKVGLSDSDGSTDTGKQNSQNNLNDAILREVWGSIISEAVDEAGLPPARLAPPQVRLMGISHNADAGDRPSLEFFARLNMTSADIKATYASGKHAEADESTDIQLMPPEQLRTLIENLKSTFCRGSASSSSGKSDTAPPVGNRSDDFIRNCSPALIGALLLADDLLLV